MCIENWVLGMRRFRLSMKAKQAARQICECCHTPIERYEFVCEKEACQIWALTGQAMIAAMPASEPEPPVLRRMVYQKPESASVSGFAIAARSGASRA